MASPRQLVAIMFTDIVGYTALMQHNEQQAVAVTKRYTAVLHNAVAAHSGQVLNDYGDGSLCILPSSMDAVKCAVSIQQQLQSKPAVPLRIGLHMGEIFFEEGKVFGDSVNIASRIQSLGTGGAVLMSKEVHDTIKNHPEFSTVPLGTFEFKNVDEPEEVFALVGEGLSTPRRDQMEGKLKTPLPPAGAGRRTAWITAAVVVVLALVTGLILYTGKGPGRTANASGRPVNTIAVLYFDNMSGDPGQEYFSDGMTEEIITRLSMIEGLRVKSRTSVLQYKDSRKPLRQIARELGVKSILEGSVRRQGNQLRVTAQLIDATRDEHVWAENYDRELKDVFSVQSDIAQNIASKFQITLSSDTREKLAAPLTANTEAYDHFLKARGLVFLEYGLGGRTDKRQEAIGLLHQALQLDPSFTEAYALLSGAYTLMSREASDPQRWIDSARLLAQAAVQNGPGKSDGYEAMAYLHENTGEIDKALQWAMKAYALRPAYMAPYISALYTRNLQFGKAMEWTVRAIEADPAEPAHYLTKSFLFYDVGLLDSAHKYIDLAVRLRPDAPNVAWSHAIYHRFNRNLAEYEVLMKEIYSRDEPSYHYNMAIFFLFNREWQSADSFYRISNHPDDMDAALARLRVGDEGTARQFFQRALQHRLAATGTWDHWRFYDVSRIYAALGDERYAEYLQKALDKGWHEYPFFERDPFFDAVRPTPGFRKIATLMRQRNERFKADLLKAI